MISNYTLLDAKYYRIVGKKPNTKIYRLPYIDKKGRQFLMKEIKKVVNGCEGYWITFNYGFPNEKKKFISVNKLQHDKSLLINERMVLNFEEKGVPF